MATVRETKRFEFFEDRFHGCTCIFDNKTKEQTLWNTGSEAQEEKEHLLGLEDKEFDEYCKERFV